jgi:pimeloyl-ACP methyl ester carboxylesterase
MDYARDYQPTQPFLIIGGSRDQILPPKSYDDLNNILPNSELMWVDGRHNLIREDPAICEQVVNLAIDFFDTQTLKTQ